MSVRGTFYSYHCIVGCFRRLYSQKVYKSLKLMSLLTYRSSFKGLCYVYKEALQFDLTAFLFSHVLSAPLHVTVHEKTALVCTW